MDLIQIDVVQAETTERGVDPGENVLAGEAAAVLSRGYRVEHLGGNYCLLAPQVFAHQPPCHHLTGAAVVDIGRVEERDAALHGGPHNGFGLLLTDRPRLVVALSECHHAQTDPGDPEAGPSQIGVLHF